VEARSSVPEAGSVQSRPIPPVDVATSAEECLTHTAEHKEILPKLRSLSCSIYLSTCEIFGYLVILPFLSVIFIVLNNKNAMSAFKAVVIYPVLSTSAARAFGECLRSLQRVSPKIDIGRKRVALPFTSAKRQVIKNYGGWSQTMMSFGLAPHNDAHIAEAHLIISVPAAGGEHRQEESPEIEAVLPNMQGP